MPDILIRGMEMPRGCGDCPLQTGARYCYGIHGFIPKSYCNSNYKKHEKCTLVELPPHGDLIEAEHLAETLDYYIREAGWGDEINEALRWVRDEFIKSETVIVPASEPTKSG